VSDEMRAGEILGCTLNVMWRNLKNLIITDNCRMLAYIITS
jgi:hypothetical protein